MIEILFNENEITSIQAAKDIIKAGDTITNSDEIFDSVICLEFMLDIGNIQEKSR